MRFDNTVQDEKQATFEPFPEGEYDFEVITAEDKISRAGNEMIAVSLNIYNDAGHKRRVFDYLLSNQQWKIKGFCEGAGMMAQYDAGELYAADMVGKTGRVKIVIQPAQGDYPEKNAVKFYVRAKAAPAAPAKSSIAQPTKREPAMAGAGGLPRSAARDLDDEVPFGPCVQ